MDFKRLQEFSTKKWQEENGIVKALSDYIEVPNMSPMFDAEWETNGLTDKALDIIIDWIKRQNIAELKLEVIREAGRTPVMLLELPAKGNSDKRVLMYGHMDKQPPLTDLWEEGLHPHKPVLRDGKLYGRGGADDGYASFASIASLMALRDQGLDHPSVVILIEACEESGSRDLPYYVDKLKDRIGDVNLIICLDSGCGNYDQLFLTTSLRGSTTAEVTVDVLKEGVHSGMGSGVVASSFRIFRHLLSDLEDPETGKILLDDLYVDIPKERLEQAKTAAGFLGDSIYSGFPFHEGGRPISDDPYELLLNRTWRPQLEITGGEGFPPCSIAGNVLRPYSKFKLAMRLPPTADPEKALQAMSKVFDKSPYGMKVTFKATNKGSGWNSPAIAPWLEKAVNDASMNAFNKPCVLMGEGGAIPFMGMLGKKFPNAQFVISGVLGPKSNAHGPNEFIHVPYAEKLTACVAYILHQAN